MLRRSALCLGALGRTRPALNYHLEPPSHDTMQEYRNMERRTPRVVHFTDTDGEEHSMTWAEYLEYQGQGRRGAKVGDDGQDAEEREATPVRAPRGVFTVKLYNVPGRGTRFQYAQDLFRDTPLEAAEVNAKFLQLDHLAEVLSSLLAKGRERAIELGISPSHVRVMKYDFAMDEEMEKFIVWRAKGFYANYYKKTYTLTLYLTECQSMEDAQRRKTEYFRWKYGKNPKREDGMASVLDVPALGVDGL